MNQYPIWIGIIVALVMVCLTSNPLWWMLIALGAGANGVVCAANGWKMPVRGVIEETIRHRPMETTTRHKWLGDFIPTGFGKASIGDFILAAGMLGAITARAYIPAENMIAALCLFWWGSGWVKGFGLFEKWTMEARRDARKNIPIVIMLLVIGNLLHVRGCSVGELHASARGALGSGDSLKAIKSPSQAKWRDLGKVLAPTDFLKRLRVEQADRDAKAAPQRKADAALQAKVQKQMDQIKQDPVSHVQKLRIRDLQKMATSSTFNVVSQTNNSFIYTTWDGTVGRWSTQRGDEVLAPATRKVPPAWTRAAVAMLPSPDFAQRIGTRKGPFCRVTCEFHHKDNLGAGSGDVEVEASYCNTQHINEQALVVPGWAQLDAQYEQRNDWPGPAQGGLDSYKLYWK